MSCAKGPDYCAYRGDTLIIPLTVTQASVALDITGYTITFNAKRDISQAANDITGAGVITNASGGLATITLTKTDTDISKVALVYDIELKNSGETVVQTYQGNFTIAQQV